MREFIVENLTNTEALSVTVILMNNVIALIAALWNAVYNTAFDWVDGKLSGRLADHRPAAWRVVHALGFEGGLVLVSVPIVVVWTGMSWFACWC